MILRAFLVAQMVKILLQCGRPGFDPWVGKIPWRRATHSSILAQRIPWTEEPGRLQSIGSQRVGQNMLSWKGKGNTTDLNILLFKM